jgi:DNA-binding FrmR family transcriptional regulator
MATKSRATAASTTGGTAAAPAGSGAAPDSSVPDEAAVSAGPAVPDEQPCGSDAPPMMTEEVRRDVLLRLRKVSGQVQGITKMVEDDRYCVDVLQQLSAVSSAVESASKVVVRNYLERCVTDAINGGDPLIYHELMRVVFKHR